MIDSLKTALAAINLQFYKVSNQMNIQFFMKLIRFGANFLAYLRILSCVKYIQTFLINSLI